MKRQSNKLFAIISLALSLSISFTLRAQIYDPVTWEF